MAHVLRMPAILAGATEAVLLTWTVEEGAEFVVGDALAEIETDKALVELAAEESATLGRTLVLAGQKVTVGDAIALLLSPGDNDDDAAAALAAVAQSADDAPTSSKADVSDHVVHLDAGLSTPMPSDSNRGHDRLFASPIVRRLARERGIDPRIITGTGPDGRIVRRDLEALLRANAEGAHSQIPTNEVISSSSHEDVAHSGMRRAIARRLTESKSTVPHFYLTAELHVDRLLTLRQEINASGDVRISVNDLLVKAIAAAFGRVPEANVIWTDDALRYFTAVDVAIAVSTDEGLVAPVVRDVASTPISTLSAGISDLVDTARTGRLQQHQLEGGSFSISNLGMYGTREFSAILNPPQSGILAVGAARPEAVVIDGALTVGQVMNVVLSVDHRAVDGALAARWLAAFTEIVENPVAILV